MSAHTPVLERKPLDQYFVGRVYLGATEALGDTVKRRKWGESKHGSPAVTVSLCAEIVRLNMEIAKMKDARDALVKALQETRNEINNLRQEIFDNGTIQGNPETMDAETKIEHDRLSKMVARSDSAIANAKGGAS